MSLIYFCIFCTALKKENERLKDFVDALIDQNSDLRDVIIKKEV